MVRGLVPLVLVPNRFPLNGYSEKMGSEKRTDQTN